MVTMGSGKGSVRLGYQTDSDISLHQRFLNTHSLHSYDVEHNAMIVIFDLGHRDLDVLKSYLHTKLNRAKKT